MIEPTAMPRDEVRRLLLADRDMACPGCGYNLRNLAGDACPECNQQLDVDVVLCEALGGSFIAAIVGLACGAGFGGIMLLGCLFLTVYYGDPAPAGIYIIPGLTVLIEGGLVASLASRGGRTWFRGLDLSTRAVAAFACWMATFVAGLMLLGYLMTAM